MEPIPYFFDSINRNAILVKPKKAFFDWVNYIYPDSPVMGKQEGDIYLIREMDSNQDIERWLKSNFDQLFKNELNNWYTDEKGWPQKRTFTMFCEWFHFEIHSMVLDLEDDDIEKE